MTSLRYRLLVHLADEGTVEHPAGKVTSVLAQALASTGSRIGTLLRVLEAEGLVERTHNPRTGRTFRVRLTHAGKVEVRRDGCVGKVLPRPRLAVVAPMPLPGPLTTVRFDPELARERALGGVA